MPRPQPSTNSCPKAAPPLKRHALPTAVVQPADHVDGRLRYGTLINGRTRILETWLLTTADRDVAARVAMLLGGELNIEEDELGQSYQVLTGYAELDVLLDGPQAIRLRMLRRHGSTILGSCNSHTQQTSHGERPCQCPVALKARRKVAKMAEDVSRWLISPAGSLATQPWKVRLLERGVDVRRACIRRKGGDSAL